MFSDSKTPIYATALAHLIECLGDVHNEVKLRRRERRAGHDELLLLQGVLMELLQGELARQHRPLNLILGLYKETNHPWADELLTLVLGDEQKIEIAQDEAMHLSPKMAKLYSMTMVEEPSFEDNDTVGFAEDLEHHAVPSTDIFGWTPLHYAAAKGSEEWIGVLRNQFAKVDVQDIRGWTPLHYACWHGHTKVVWDLTVWSFADKANLIHEVLEKHTL